MNATNGVRAHSHTACLPARTSPAVHHTAHRRRTARPTWCALGCDDRVHDVAESVGDRGVLKTPGQGARRAVTTASPPADAAASCAVGLAASPGQATADASAAGDTPTSRSGCTAAPARPAGPPPPAATALRRLGEHPARRAARWLALTHHRAALQRSNATAPLAVSARSSAAACVLRACPLPPPAGCISACRAAAAVLQRKGARRCARASRWRRWRRAVGVSGYDDKLRSCAHWAAARAHVENGVCVWLRGWPTEGSVFSEDADAGLAPPAALRSHAAHFGARHLATWAVTLLTGSALATCRAAHTAPAAHLAAWWTPRATPARCGVACSRCARPLRRSLRAAAFAATAARRGSLLRRRRLGAAGRGGRGGGAGRGVARAHATWRCLQHGAHCMRWWQRRTPPSRRSPATPGTPASLLRWRRAVV
jgi:hypothetical protein